MDFFYPASCFICASPLQHNQILCTACTKTLPWTSLTPIVKDAMGIQINNIIVHQCIVLFWTNDKHFLQTIIQNMNETSNISWVSFFAKQIAIKIKALKIQVDGCFVIPNHKKGYKLNSANNIAMDSILHQLHNDCKIPVLHPFKGSEWRLLNCKPPLFLKKQKKWKDTTLLVLVDSLSNPYINQYIKAFNKENAKNIILLSIINRI